MTLDELILINSDKVRRDSSLMVFYKEAFLTTFGYNPTCTGCTFSSDWNKLVNFARSGNIIEVGNSKTNIMQTFKLKKIQNIILAYRQSDQTFRKYDNLMDEDYAIAYLTNGSEEEITERKKIFEILPTSLQSDNDEILPTMRNTEKEINLVAEQKGIDVSDLKTKGKKIAKIKKSNGR